MCCNCSLLLSLSTTRIYKHFSFLSSRCLWRAGIHQVGIFTAPKGPPKMSTRPRRAPFFITLFILERKGNNKNNRIDLNRSKGNIFYLNVFFLSLSLSHTAPREVIPVQYIRVWRCTARFRTIAFYESLGVHEPCSTSLFLKDCKAFVIVFMSRSCILYQWSVTSKKSVQHSVSESALNKVACMCLYFCIDHVQYSNEVVASCTLLFFDKWTLI